MKNSPTDPIASPLLYPSHADLPPAVVQVAGLDLLRDEGLLYEKLLREAGVKTRLHVSVNLTGRIVSNIITAFLRDRYPGLSHGFHVAHPHFKASQQFEENFKKGLRWLLEGAKDS